MLIQILAIDKNRLMGSSKENKLPWENKEDLKFLKSITKGQDVLVGHTTYMSLKGYYKDKPLPFGKVYVASKFDYTYSDAIRISDLESFLKNEEYNTLRDIYIIGGATIYSISFDYCSSAFVTYIDREYEGDVFLPDNVQYETEKFNISSQIHLNNYTRVVLYTRKYGEI